MLGYLFLTLSLFSGTTKGFLGKKISYLVNGYKESAIVNFVRMLICSLIGAAIVIFQSSSFFKMIDSALLLSAFLSGVSTAVFIISWLIAVKKGAYVMLDIFIMLGVGITLLLCNVFLGESVKPLKILGLSVLVIAAYIMCSYNVRLNGKMTLGNLVLLILCGCANGITDFSQKLFVRTAQNTNAAVFNFYSYIFSAAVLLVFLLLFRKKETISNTFSENKAKIFCFVVFMAICLFLNSYFKTLAATFISSDILYPLSSGLALILSAIMAAVFFKEKITFYSILGVFLAIVALLIINFV